MAWMLELSDQEFKTTMINMMQTLIDKVDYMQEQMNNVSKEVEILRKSNAADKKTLTEMKNLDGLVGVDMAQTLQQQNINSILKEMIIYDMIYQLVL